MCNDFLTLFRHIDEASEEDDDDHHEEQKHTQHQGRLTVVRGRQVGRYRKGREERCVVG